MLTSQFTDSSLQDVIIGVLEGVLRIGGHASPVYPAQQFFCPERSVYLPQTLRAIESSKGSDHAALYLIGSCAQCLQYWRSEETDAWKDLALKTLRTADRNYPEVRIAVSKLWDMLAGRSSKELMSRIHRRSFYDAHGICGNYEAALNSDDQSRLGSANELPQSAISESILSSTRRLRAS